MAGPAWLVDSNRIATKIRSASGAIDHNKVDWKSNPTRTCPSCQHVIDNSDVVQQWPGLPQGVKFDPSDQEIIWHLLAKNGCEGFLPHPFINEFIPTVNEDVGICYTHPQNLPGVKQDGGVVHFFHRAIKAYNTGTRKRRKIIDDDADVRWHKTGRTKPVMLDGVHKGCKKIMVLYTILVKGGKSEKTNWVMHQYHLGTEEDEKDGEYVISKILFQQQQLKQGEKSEQDVAECSDMAVAKVDPVTPKSVTPDPPRNERLASSDLVQNWATSLAKKVDAEVEVALDVEVPTEVEMALDVDVPPDVEVVQTDCDVQFNAESDGHENVDGMDNHIQDDPKWWDSELQNLLDSQQLVEGLSLCDEFLASRSPDRDGSTDNEKLKKVDPVTPKSVTPDPPRNERLASSDLVQNWATSLAKKVDTEVEVALDVEVPTEVEMALDVDVPPDVEVVQTDCDVQFNAESDGHENVDDIDNHIQDDPKWWDSESQNLLDSQQLVEGLSLCDEFLASQSPDRDGSTDNEKLKSRSRLSDYSHLGPEDLKKDLEECQKLVLDPANIELDTPPEFRLSQLEFGSQDSYLAWGVGKMGD